LARRRVLPVVAATLAAALACARESPPPAPALLTGTFSLGEDYGCVVQSAAVGADSVRFQLSCLRGPPTYNLGYLTGRLRVIGDSAVYESVQPGLECLLTMKFLGSRVVLRQKVEQGACGFGYGVVATGELRRIADGVPPFDLAPYGSASPP